MSLRVFHIFFVAIVILFLVGFGGWAFQQYRTDGQTVNLVLAVGSLIAGIIFIGYGGWFIHKMKGLPQT